MAVYAATKGGNERDDAAPHARAGKLGIRVNSIAPGYLRTEMSESLKDVQLENSYVERRWGVWVCPRTSWDR